MTVYTVKTMPSLCQVVLESFFVPLDERESNYIKNDLEAKE